MGIRDDLEKYPGGDGKQLWETKRALERLGVECFVRDEVSSVEYRKVDLVHLFNTTRIRETYDQFLEATAHGVPVVLSTIWHSMREVSRYLAWKYRIPKFPVWSYSALREAYYSRRAGSPVNWRTVFGYRTCQRAVVEGAAAVLPNSWAELQSLKYELGTDPRSFFIIPNGVRIPDQIPSAERPRRDILCAGRIEPRKNQLSVIDAYLRLNSGNDRLLLAGAINESHRTYARKVLSRMQPGRIEYLGVLSQSELFRRYRQAKVTVLASFFETTGLVVLEGLANGTNAVVLESATTREYFGDVASFCDPYSPSSIAAAIRQALDNPPLDVSDLVKRYSWSETGRLTLEAYEAVLRAEKATEAS